MVHREPVGWQPEADYGLNGVQDVLVVRRQTAAAAAAADHVDHVPTAADPADSPNTVTFPGSPPKTSTLSRTQRSASIWSI